MEARIVDKAVLIAEAAARKAEGKRFVTISCVELESDDCDLIYHFDQDLELENLRCTVPRNEPVPSISGVYLAAFLVENEIQDQFGLRFEGLVLDFGRSLYLDEEVTTLPFCRYSVSTQQD